MSLIGFHRVLVATAIVFFISFSIWELASFRATGDIWAAVVGVGVGVAAVALAYYLKHLDRFLKPPEQSSWLPGHESAPLSRNGHRAAESEWLRKEK